MRELIYREILEYHPHMLADYLAGGRNHQSNFMYPSAVDNFRRQFAHLESASSQGNRPQAGQNLGQVCRAPWPAYHTMAPAESALYSMLCCGCDNRYSLSLAGSLICVSTSL